MVFFWLKNGQSNEQNRKKTLETYITIVRDILDWIANYLEIWASLVAQRLKRLPPMRETRVRSLGREDPLEKEMATHSGTLA